MIVEVVEMDVETKIKISKALKKIEKNPQGPYIRLLRPLLLLLLLLL
jgi:hypothetical protein